ncbi:hypothetical protein [Bradyrhizobium zhanjiangense]|uniref:Uncharacterized protein n=1 Tax=Bradyrhizobium zhanjiangense TaxID=1325107 RepID=A0A4Q0Q7U6_9BRAD|nr:hypothetical protein [Bradyrhizobium zhanjiangense]RXG85105.1 hypothetical protein EAS61_37175 [Bradyrhizobium zhanjiangense]
MQKYSTNDCIISASKSVACAQQLRAIECHLPGTAVQEGRLPAMGRRLLETLVSGFGIGARAPRCASPHRSCSNQLFLQQQADQFGLTAHHGLVEYLGRMAARRSNPGSKRPSLSAVSLILIAALSYWARSRLVVVLRRKANLTGTTVIEGRGAYSTMIGNLPFEAPNACASDLAPRA